MSAIDKLISYIMTLSPDQAEKAVTQLPLLKALVNEQSENKAEYILAITKALHKTSDILLLDLILKLLQKSNEA